MAIPPRRWGGVALLIVGLSLLFDTYTFLRTDWSPLHVPMSVPNELALGYSLGVIGIVVLLAPALIRTVDPFASDPSMKMGAGLAYDSVEVRLRQRLPLKPKFTFLPNRGLVGGAMILLLLAPVFVMVTQHDLGKGIYVRLVPRHHSGPDENCLEGPIVVAVKRHEHVSQLFLNGTEVGREQLETALKSKLAGRANWEVSIEGDDVAEFAELMFAIDVVNSLHAKAVILTPKLKYQMAKACSSR